MNLGISQNINISDHHYPTKMYRIIFYFYIFLSFYEGYINQIIGSYTKYYIFGFIVLYLFSYNKIKIDKVHWLILIWFFLKILSIFWGQNSPFQSGNLLTHMFAHIGMIGLFITLTLVKFDSKFVLNIININLYVSFSMAFLGLFFSKPYLGVMSRQVLTLFNTQIDPNNLAALYAVGFGLAMYKLVNDPSTKFLHLFITIINGYGLTMTGSRAGLATIAIIIISSVLMHSEKKKEYISVAKKLITVFLMTFLLSYIVRNFLPYETYKRLFSFSAYSSASGRDDLWETGIEMFFKRPIFGWGWGGSPVEGSHNTFLTMALETGIIGLGIFLCPIIIVLRKVWINKNNIAVIILLSSLIPAFFIDSINKRFFWNGIIFALLVSMTSVLQKSD